MEKNAQPGGRAAVWEHEGFRFDMGPSWYWMPDIFDRFFARFGRQTEEFYSLTRLDPSYRVYFEDESVVDVPAGMEALEALFESREPGSAQRLRDFLEQAEFKYRFGLGEYAYRPSLSVREFIDLKTLRAAARIGMFGSFRRHVRSFFKDDHLRQIVEFPVLFLGATPGDTPAMYSLMNHADMKLGTWYPAGGMSGVIAAMVKLADELGVQFRFDHEVEAIETANGIASSVKTRGERFFADVVVAGADYRHVEQNLLPAGDRDYTPEYWDGRVLSPSSLIFYLGLNKELSGVHHHTLFFDEDLDKHAHEIYKDPRWPSRPLFYVSCPSKTDPAVAPEGCENVFILVPVAPGLQDDDETRERIFDVVMDRFERLTQQSIRDAVVVKRSYAHREFSEDYHAFKGNAYGLANTLMQTAFLKPRMRSKKVKNLYYTGQLTVPGPGVPPSLISGEVVSDLIVADFRSRR